MISREKEKKRESCQFWVCKCTFKKMATFNSHGNAEISYRQMWKILRKQYLTLIGVKLLNTFPWMEKLNTLSEH